MADLVLGPILRHVSETDATVWVETSQASVVEILGHTAATFEIEGHHYALVLVEGLAPGTAHEYAVALDGARAWPPRDSEFPPSVIRTLGHAGPLRVAFGSCRVALPHEPPYSLPKDADPRGRGPDALQALAARMRHEPPGAWPDLLVMLGDQVYADEVSPGTREFIRRRRGLDGPHGDAVADFEEYHHLYLDAWGEPTIRWLLSTVATAMIFDDHDVHDDWNTSLAWWRRMEGEEWWHEHITAALTSYWVYQHLGNLAPAVLAADPLYARARDGDATAAVRDHARRADRDPEAARWSFRREFGGTRLVVVDSRAARVLDPDRRSMLAESEWRWLDEQLTGDVDHLLIATSLPFVLAPGLHGLEQWSEAVCSGAWGRRLEPLGERVRERLDLEHWAAFDRSFRRLAATLEEVAAGRRGAPPATIVVLSGDVHHAYLAAVELPGAKDGASAVYQAVCSPFRNELDRHERVVVRATCSRAGGVVGGLLAAAAGRGRRPMRWRLEPRQPWFDNQVAELELDGRHATIAFQKAVSPSGRGADLVDNLRRPLT